MIPSLNYAVLTNALQALNEGNIRHCEDLGFTFDEMNALSQLSPDALFTLSRAAAPFIAVSLRHDVLHQLLAHSGQEEQRRQLIDRAIRLGGSIALMNHYLVSPPMKSAFAVGCWVSACRMAERLNRMKRQMWLSGCNGSSAG